MSDNTADPYTETPLAEAMSQPWWRPEMRNTIRTDADLTPEMEAFLQSWYAKRGFNLDDLREAERQCERGEGMSGDEFFAWLREKYAP